MSFTNPPADTSKAATIGQWLKTPTFGYHTTDGVTFGRTYTPNMGGPLPPSGQNHPAKTVVKTQAPAGQNLYSLYGNPASAYYQNTIGQR